MRRTRSRISLYDAAGNLTRRRYDRKDADNVVVTEGSIHAYDALNREVSRQNATNPADSERAARRQEAETRYNAYGEVTGRRTNGGNATGEWQEYAEYNAIGKVAKSNSGSGITKAHLYDANGNATLTIESTGTLDYGTMTLDQARAAGANNALRISVYDKRDQVVRHIQPNFTVENVLAAIDRVTSNVVGGTMFAGGTVSVVASTSLPPVAPGGATALGHVHATSLPAGTTLAVSLNLTIVAAVTNTYMGSVTVYSGNYVGKINSLSVPLPNLGWYGEGDFEVEYSDSSGVSASARAQQSASVASVNLATKGSGTYTVRIYKWLDANVRVLVGEGSGSVPGFGTWQSGSVPASTTGSVYFNITPPARSEFQIAGQPAGATSITFETQQSGSSTWVARTATQRAVGTYKVPGWFVVDATGWTAANYKFRYTARNAGGTVVNSASGELNASTSAATIVQFADASGAGSVSGVSGDGTAFTAAAAATAPVGQAAGITLTGSFAGKTQKYVSSFTANTLNQASGYYRFFADTLTVNLPQLAGLAPATYEIDFLGKTSANVAYTRSKTGIAISASSTTFNIGEVVEGSYTINVYAVSSGARKLVAQGAGTQARGATWSSTGTVYTQGTVISQTAATVNTSTATLAVPKQVLITAPSGAGAYTFDQVQFGYRAAGSNAAWQFLTLSSRVVATAPPGPTAAPSCSTRQPTGWRTTRTTR